MTTLITDGPETAQGATSSGAKPHKKAPARERRAHVAPAKAKSGKKPGPVKKAPKGGKKGQWRRRRE